MLEKQAKYVCNVGLVFWCSGDGILVSTVHLATAKVYNICQQKLFTQTPHSHLWSSFELVSLRLLLCVHGQAAAILTVGLSVRGQTWTGCRLTPEET